MKKINNRQFKILQSKQLVINKFKVIRQQIITVSHNKMLSHLNKNTILDVVLLLISKTLLKI